MILYLSRKKSDKVRKELEEAAREGGSRSSGSGGSTDDKIMDSMPYYAASLPNKVALRFVSVNYMYLFILYIYKIFIGTKFHELRQA